MATKISKTALSTNPEKEMISELLENGNGDISMIDSYKEDLREMYILMCEGKKYREEFTENYRDSLGFTFRKLSDLLDAIGNNIIIG